MCVHFFVYVVALVMPQKDFTSYICTLIAHNSLNRHYESYQHLVDPHDPPWVHTPSTTHMTLVGLTNECTNIANAILLRHDIGLALGYQNVKYLFPNV